MAVIRSLAATVCVLLFAAGCSRNRQQANTAAPNTIQLEEIPSPELTLSANLIPNAQTGTLLELTLRNIGHRTLAIDTGYQALPLANFQFSLELPDHQWRDAVCNACTPAGVSLNPQTHTIWLKPSQSQRFTVPLSTIAAADPHTGRRLDRSQMHGLLYVTLRVPTPPDAHTGWPGVVTGSVQIP